MLVEHNLQEEEAAEVSHLNPKTTTTRTRCETPPKLASPIPMIDRGQSTSPLDSGDRLLLIKECHRGAASEEEQQVIRSIKTTPRCLRARIKSWIS